MLYGGAGAGKTQILRALASICSSLKKEVTIITASKREFMAPFTKLYFIPQFYHYQRLILDDELALKEGSFLLIDGISNEISTNFKEYKQEYKLTLSKLSAYSIQQNITILFTNKLVFDGRPWQWQLNRLFSDSDLLLTREREYFKLLIFQKKFLGRCLFRKPTTAATLILHLCNYAKRGHGPSNIIPYHETTGL